MTDTPSEPIRGLWFTTWGKRELSFTVDYQMIGGVPFVPNKATISAVLFDQRSAKAKRAQWRSARAEGVRE